MPRSRGGGVGRRVSDSLRCVRCIPGVPAAPSSPGPAIPGKKGELHYPAGLLPPSFLSSLCTWPEGREGPGRHSPTFSFPVSEQGSFFFFPSSTPSPPPARPSLPLSFPSLPPSLPSRLGLCAGAPIPSAAGTRGTRGRSRLSRAFSLPSPSLPPSPTPDSDSERRPEEPRGEHPPARPPLSVSSACGSIRGPAGRAA